MTRSADYYNRSERFGQASLTQNRVGGVAAGNPDRNRKVSLCDRAVPDFVAASPLPDEPAAGRAQQLPQGSVELRRHSADSRLGFAQGSDLQEQIARIDIGVIVGK